MRVCPLLLLAIKSGLGGIISNPQKGEAECLGEACAWYVWPSEGPGVSRRTPGAGECAINRIAVKA
jgi:hypothetical protein